ncbi:MAG: hypothetical protein Q9208_003947 [Pyrenodesmia sp. 3 TL-2023]
MAQELDDRHHQRTEENIEKLRKSIRIWQTWEAEYEGLREELHSVGSDAAGSALEDVGKQFHAELLNQKEINLLLRDDKKQPRTSKQVIGLLSRRIEYVQSNIKSLQGSLRAEEEKLPTSQVLSAAQQKDEESFPLMEIREDLDEDDNVTSSSMTPASEAAPYIVEALKKAGVPGLQSPQKVKAPEQTVESRSEQGNLLEDLEGIPSAVEQGRHSPLKHSPDQTTSPSTSESDAKGDGRKAGRRRKSVTFADGTKQAPPTPTQPRPARDVQAAKAASTARRIKAEVRGSIDALKKVHEAGYINEEAFDRFRKEYVERMHNIPSTMDKEPIVQSGDSNVRQHNAIKEDTTPEKFDPVVPLDESPEDAALRKEMIQYNMNEVGAVVAQMDLDDEDPDDSASPGYSTEEGEHRGSSDEDENDWGLNTGRALTNDYIKEMQALEQKLKPVFEQIADPTPTVEALLQAEKELTVGPDGNPIKQISDNASTAKEKKAVRFAQDLRIQERPPSPRHETRKSPKVKRGLTPVNADVIERPVTGKGTPNTTMPHPSKRVSRFKTTRSPQGPPAAAPRKSPHLQVTASNGNQVKTPSLPAFTPPATPKMTPMGPPGQTHAPNVVERPYSEATVINDVSEPDEFDASLMRQELTMDYHRTRNRMIQRQGGFLANDDDEEQEEGPLVDENGRKISRFKAARLKGMDG